MNILITGISGFIGGHLGYRLEQEGHSVTGVDIKPIEHWKESDICSTFIRGDLREQGCILHVFEDHAQYDEVYQLAADMGGAGYIFTGEHDADVMHNSALINLNVAKACIEYKAGRVFYSSSACIYPGFNQTDPDNPNCIESSAYPSQPDSEYGWEKLFSERLYKAFERNYNLDVRIARFHNIFGPYGCYKGDRSKAPAAICRKVAEAQVDSWSLSTINDPRAPINLGHIDIWGDGKQTRSFLYIDECVEGIIRLMRSDCTEVLNIGSEEMISINDLAKMVIRISGKNLTISNIPGPTGVAGRNSHNQLIWNELGWKPTQPLEEGMIKLYNWINEQINDGTGTK